jgi:hypothetical protein
METLADYPTAISRLRLSETETKVVVFEAEASVKGLEVRGCSFGIGQPRLPAIDVWSGSYTILVPKEARAVSIRAGMTYLFEVWSPDGRRHWSTSVHIPSGTPEVQ